MEPEITAKAEVNLGLTLPTVLRTIYESADGRFREDGQWWVVWPLDRLVEDNLSAWRAGRLPSGLLAFGDDGTGNPFCIPVSEASDRVVHWSWIDDDVEAKLGTMDEFLREWAG